MSSGKRTSRQSGSATDEPQTADAAVVAPAPPTRAGPAADSAPTAHDAASEAQALSAFFRGLAARAEHDPAFGAGLLSVAQASGLARLAPGEPSPRDAGAAIESATAPAVEMGSADGAAAPTPQPTATIPSAATPQRKGKRARSGDGASVAAPIATTGASQAAPDPFAVLRGQGEAGLRATLDALDLATLRQIVRAHRFDPARISARWANRDRVIALIMEQTRARLNHGRAFERI